MKEKKKEIFIIVGCLLVIVLSVSLAWFSMEILGEGNEISVDSANLKIIFTSGNGTISSTNIEPGWSSEVNTFTVKNESNDTYKYNIIIKDLVNTFVTNGYLVYKITSTDGGYNMSEFKDIPKSSTATDTILAYSVEIAKGKTHSYSVEFKYINNESVDQSDDMGKVLSGALVIGEGTEKVPTLAELIQEKSLTNTDGVYNENGYRYEGSNPNNYIQMTNKSTNTTEMWRIIGLFPDGENGEEVVRVRRYYEQGSYPTMAYDTNYITHWPNTTMYSSLSSTYSLENYANTVNFKMYLGTSSSYSSITSEGWYSAERGSTPGATASSSYSSSVLFTGPVGLMYPSDYGYGVLASDCARTRHMVGYSGTCNNNWLYQGSSTDQWLISPSARYNQQALLVEYDGNVYDYRDYGVTAALAYSPVMALSASTTVTGSGTSSDPYIVN